MGHVSSGLGRLGAKLRRELHLLLRPDGRELP